MSESPTKAAPPRRVPLDEIMNELNSNNKTVVKRKIQSIAQLHAHLNLIVMLMDSINEDYLDTSWEYNFAAFLDSIKSVPFDLSLENNVQIERLKYLRNVLKVHFSIQDAVLNSFFTEQKKKIECTLRVLQSIQIVEDYLNEFLNKINLLNLKYIERVKSRLLDFKDLFVMDDLCADDEALKNNVEPMDVEVEEERRMVKRSRTRDDFDSSISGTKNLYDSILQENDIVFGTKITNNAEPMTIVCEDNTTKDKNVKSKSKSTEEWNLTEGSMTPMTTIEWKLTNFMKENKSKIEWNLSYQQVNVPDFIFNTVNELLKSFDALNADGNGIKGDAVVKAIAEVKSKFLDVVNDIYDSLPFLKEMDLNINMQRPKLRPKFMIDLKGVFDSYKMKLRKYCSSLCPWISKYRSLEEFMNYNWAVDSKLDEDHNYAKKTMIRAFLQYTIVNYISRNQTANLIYDKNITNANRLVSDLYINLGSIQTTNMLNNTEEFVTFSRSIAYLQNKEKSINSNQSKRKLLLDSASFKV